MDGIIWEHFAIALGSSLSFGLTLAFNSVRTLYPYPLSSKIHIASL
jgi:hypothetical protein